jgi:hypothetical protein
MPEELFHVIADGSPAAGFDAAAVAEQLQQQLKLTATQAQRLLGGKPIVAKRAVTHAVAEKYCARLSALGLLVHLEASAEDQPAAAPSAPTPIDTSISVAASIDTGTDNKTDTSANTKAADWPALTDFFADVPTPLSSARYNVRYLQQLVVTMTRALSIICSYSGIALISAVVWLLFTWHFAYLLTAPPLFFSIPVFIIPCLAMLLLAMLLLRPFYPLQHSSIEAVALHAHLQPQLFHWLAQLCEVVAAPMPQTLNLDTGIATSATLRKGVGAFWRGEYDLTLSLPLLDIGTLRDNSGLLAATLGSQANPAALRCSRLLAVIGERLRACLDNRDWLSEKIVALEQRYPIAKIAIVFIALRKIITQHNRLLARFADSVAVVQQHLQLQTLLEADRLQTLIAGNEHFADSLLQQHKLADAYRDANALNFQDRIEGGLVADLPALIRHYYDNFDANAEQLLRKQWRDVAARGRAVLPTPGERIEAARARDDNGALSASALAATPAATLLVHQPALATQITAAFYRGLGLTFDVVELLPVDELTFAANEDILRKQQAALYFNNWFRPHRFWRLADYALIRDMPTGDASMQLNVCINEIRRLTPDRMRQLNEYERLQNQIQELLIGQLVMAQGRPYQFRYISYDGTTLQPLLEERQQQMAKLMEQLVTQETIMGGRITLGLRLSGQAARDAEDLHRALRLSSAIETRLYKLSLDVFQLEQLVQRHATLRDADYRIPIKRLEEKVNDASALLHERLKEIPYPLDVRYATLNDYVIILVEKSKSRASASIALDRARRLLQILYGFNEALARLAADSGTIAEEAYNIEPIKLIG